VIATHYLRMKCHPVSTVNQSMGVYLDLCLTARALTVRDRGFIAVCMCHLSWC